MTGADIAAADHQRPPRVEPKASQMVVLTVCWSCYTGQHTACAYIGHHPDHTAGAVGADCICSRMQHPDQIPRLGTSTRLYDAAGSLVVPGPTAQMHQCPQCPPANGTTVWADAIDPTPGQTRSTVTGRY